MSTYPTAYASQPVAGSIPYAAPSQYPASSTAPAGAQYLGNETQTQLVPGGMHYEQYGVPSQAYVREVRSHVHTPHCTPGRGCHEHHTTQIDREFIQPPPQVVTRAVQDPPHQVVRPVNHVYRVPGQQQIIPETHYEQQTHIDKVPEDEEQIEEYDDVEYEDVPETVMQPVTVTRRVARPVKRQRVVTRRVVKDVPHTVSVPVTTERVVNTPDQVVRVPVQ
jgi:hypothetical protein